MLTYFFYTEQSISNTIKSVAVKTLPKCFNIHLISDTEVCNISQLHTTHRLLCKLQSSVHQDRSEPKHLIIILYQTCCPQLEF